MKPQDRNLAEDWIDKEWSKIYQECMDSDGFLNDVKIKRFIRNVEAKTQQETVKGCLEAHETARGQLCLKHADDDCDCDYCYHFHSAVKEINLKYQTKE